MGIALIVIFTVIFIYSFVLMKQGLLRTVTWSVAILGLILTLATVTMGDTHHWGMKPATVTKIKRIDPAFSIKDMDLHVAIKKQLGTKGENVVVYKNQGSQKTTHSQLDSNTKNQFTRVREHSSQLITTTKEYTYKNSFFKLLYAGLGTDHEYVSRVNNFQITDDWIVLTPTQVKKMQSQMKAQQASSKKMLASVIKQQVTAAKMQNPNMTAAQQAKLVQKIKSAAIANAAAKAKAKIKAMSVE